MLMLQVGPMTEQRIQDKEQHLDIQLIRQLVRSRTPGKAKAKDGTIMERAKILTQKVVRKDRIPRQKEKEMQREEIPKASKRG